MPEKATKYVEAQRGQIIVVAVGDERIVSVHHNSVGAIRVTVHADTQQLEVKNDRKA